MPKKVKFIPEKFIDAYQAKNEFGYVYTIRQIAKNFKIAVGTVNFYKDHFKLKGRGKGNTRNVTCKGCQHPFEVCVCMIAHG